MYTNIHKISINNDIFYIHEHILKETSAFKYLFDASIEMVSNLHLDFPKEINKENIDKDEINSENTNTNLDIPNVTKSEIEYVFSLLYCSRQYSIISLIDKNDQPISIISNILRAMMIIGINQYIIDNYIVETINCHENFLFELINEANYEDYFLLVIKYYYKTHDVSYIRSIASILINKNFPNKFNLKIITRLIKNIYSYSASQTGSKLVKEFDYVLAITYKYHDIDSSTRQNLSRDEKNVGTAFNKTICDVYKKFFDTDIKISLGDTDLKIAIFKINDISIDIIHKPTITPGTIGTNMFKSIIINVAEILLGIKQILINEN